MDDLDLPLLARATSNNAVDLPSYSSLCRKRTRSDYDDEPATSSDPALFSGDEQAPDAENYASKRKKKMYRGSWWNHGEKAGKAERKREFRRNYDSGIFMGSEGSDAIPSSDSFGSMEEELVEDQRRKEENSSVAGKALAAPIVKPGAEFARKPVLEQPELSQARAIIQRCLDRGQEDVDLSSMSLSSLPTELAELATLTKQTNIVPGMLDHGTLLEPELRLFLSNNLLTYIPQPIVSLHNLRVLSLRQNSLTIIPPSFRELVNLHTLNLAGNELEVLPFEILELVALHNLDQIIAEPNPWLPLPDKVAIRTLGRPGTRSQMWRFASTEPPPAPQRVHKSTGSQAGRSQAPLLSEVVLRQLARLRPQSDLSQFMPQDTSPNVINRLNLLRKEEGGCERRCTRCDRPIVSPGAQWLEWWTWSTKGEDAQGLANGSARGRGRRIIGVRGGGGGAEDGNAANNHHGSNNNNTRPEGEEEQEREEGNNEWGWLPFVRMVCHARCEGRKNAWCDEVEIEEE